MKHAKRSGWRPFWAALCAALLVLLPLVGGTVLLTRRMLHTQLLAQNGLQPPLCILRPPFCK